LFVIANTKKKKKRNTVMSKNKKNTRAIERQRQHLLQLERKARIDGFKNLWFERSAVPQPNYNFYLDESLLPEWSYIDTSRHIEISSDLKQKIGNAIHRYEPSPDDLKNDSGLCWMYVEIGKRILTQHLGIDDVEKVYGYLYSPNETWGWNNFGFWGGGHFYLRVGDELVDFSRAPPTWIWGPGPIIRKTGIRGLIMRITILASFTDHAGPIRICQMNLEVLIGKRK
jgi:hypothetical protein